MAIIVFQRFCRVYHKIPFPFFPLLRANIYVQLFLGTLSRYSKKQCSHRSDVLITDCAHQTQITNAVVVPPWKKELAEKRKQRSPVTGNQASGKENEPSTFSELPLWQREIAERRKRREFLPGQELPEKTDNSTERPEWQRRLKNTRRNQPIVAPKGPSEDSAESVPSFMKEFEKKKRACPRGKYFCQVETNYNQRLAGSYRLHQDNRKRGSRVFVITANDFHLTTISLQKLMPKAV